MCIGSGNCLLIGPVANKETTYLNIAVCQANRRGYQMEFQCCFDKLHEFIAPGNAISFYRGSIMHFAVCVGASAGKSIKLAHDPGNKTKTGTGIEMITLDEVVLDCSGKVSPFIVWRCGPMVDEALCRKAAVGKALMSVGNRQYNLIRNNCEHFASYCCNFGSGCAQVTGRIAELISILAAVMGCVLAIWTLFSNFALILLLSSVILLLFSITSWKSKTLKNVLRKFSLWLTNPWSGRLEQRIEAAIIAPNQWNKMISGGSVIGAMDVERLEEFKYYLLQILSLKKTCPEKSPERYHRIELLSQTNELITQYIWGVYGITKYISGEVKFHGGIVEGLKCITWYILDNSYIGMLPFHLSVGIRISKLLSKIINETHSDRLLRYRVLFNISNILRWYTQKLHSGRELLFVEPELADKFAAMIKHLTYSCIKQFVILEKMGVCKTSYSNGNEDPVEFGGEVLLEKSPFHTVKHISAE